MITIGSPALTGSAHFTVTIKDIIGATVYGPVSKTNAPFDPAITTPGDYTMYVDNNGAVNGWCFTVPECDQCPVLQSVVINSVSGNYYADFNFDMSGSFQCPFVIAGKSTAGFPYSFTINSLANFTSHVGSVYTKTFLIGGSPGISYTIVLTNGLHCASGDVTYACAGPVVNSLFPVLTTDGAGGYTIKTKYDDCGDTCHLMIWNYTQVVSSGSPDIGTFTDSVGCPASGSQISHAVTPAGVIPGDTIVYNVSTSDCCGVTHNYTLSYVTPCTGPVPTNVQTVKISGNYYVRITLPDCGASCHKINLTVIQGNALNSGAPYGHFFPNIDVPCGGTFPMNIDIQIFPNLDINITPPNATDLVLSAVVTNCCVGSINQNWNINIAP